MRFRGLYRVRYWILGAMVAYHIAIYIAALVNQSFLTDDSIQYLTLSENLSSRGIWSQSYEAPFVPDVQRTPGYPVFLMLLGNIPWLILLVQHVLVFVSAWLVFKIITISHDKILGWGGALFFLLQPYQVVFGSLVLSEAVFIPILLLGCWRSLLYYRQGRLIDMLLALLAFCIAAFVKPVLFPLIPAIILLGFWDIFKSGKGIPLRLAVLVALPLLILGGWMYRNKEISGRFSFTSMGDMGMLHGRLGGLESFRNHDGADEHKLYMYGDSVAALELGFSELRTYYAEKQTHETELLHGGVKGITFQYFFKYPIDAIAFQGKSFFQMMAGIGKGWTGQVCGSETAGWFFGGLQLLCNVVLYFGFFLAIIKWRKADAFTVLGGIIVVGVLLVSAAAWSDGRYRMIIDPILVCITVSAFAKLQAKKFR